MVDYEIKNKIADFVYDKLSANREITFEEVIKIVTEIRELKLKDNDE